MNYLNEKKIQLDEQQQSALDAMKAGKNVFLTGEAGTGKSTVIHAFREQCGEGTVFLAPTGIAALNIQGATIHSFFQLPLGVLVPGQLKGINNAERRQLIKNVKTVVIDEISMVRSDLFAAIDTRLRCAAEGRNSQLPFGGKQIIAVGDFFQLPAWAKSANEQNYLKAIFGGLHPFQTRQWHEANFENILLKEVHRQEQDELFCKILNRIRHADFTADLALPNSEEGNFNMLAALNLLCVNEKCADDVITLCTTNSDSLIVNNRKANAIDGKVHRFTASVSGEFKEGDAPCATILDLKVGERVMTVANKYDGNGTMEYCNGDLGEITAIEDDVVRVRFDKGTETVIKPFLWQNLDYDLAKNEAGKLQIIQKVIGTFSQLPLKLAYAQTIHKSQGLTFDQVHVKLGNGCFAPGQLYTALSRCRTLDGLSIDRELKQNDISFDAAVVKFYQSFDKANEATATDGMVTLAIPAQYAAKVAEFLKNLVAQAA